MDQIQLRAMQVPPQILKNGCYDLENGHLKIFLPFYLNVIILQTYALHEVLDIVWTYLVVYFYLTCYYITEV